MATDPFSDIAFQQEIGQPTFVELIYTKTRQGKAFSPTTATVENSLVRLAYGPPGPFADIALQTPPQLAPLPPHPTVHRYTLNGQAQTLSRQQRQHNELLSLISNAVVPQDLVPCPATITTGDTDCPNVAGCKLDVLVVLDDTGSMKSVITNVKASLNNLLTALNTATSGNLRAGLILFRDTVRINTHLTNLCGTASLGTVQNQIAAVTAVAGEELPEASDVALATAIAGEAGAWRTDALRVIVLVTDALPAGDDDRYQAGIDDVNAHQIALQAATCDIQIVAVNVGAGVTSAANIQIRPIMQDYAATTGGTYVESATGINLQALLTSYFLGLCAAIVPPFCAGANKVINGEFLTDVDGWTTSGTVNWVATLNGRMHLSGFSSAGQTIFNLTPGNTVSLSFLCTAQADSTITYGFGDDTTVTILASATTQTLQAEFTVPDDGFVTVTINCATGGEVLIDNVIVCELQMEDCGVGSQNLITNSDFEDGIEDWTDENGIQLPIADDAYWDSAVNAIKIDLLAATTARFRITGLTARQNIIVSFELLSHTPTDNGDLELKYAILNSADSVLTGGSIFNRDVTFPHRLTITATLPVGTDGLVYVQFQAGATSGLARVRNVLACTMTGVCQTGQSRLAFDRFISTRGGWAGGTLVDEAILLSAPGDGNDTLRQTFTNLLPGSEFSVTLVAMTPGGLVAELTSGSVTDQSFSSTTAGIKTFSSTVQPNGLMTVVLKAQTDAITLDDILVCQGGSRNCDGSVHKISTLIRWNGIPRSPTNFFNLLARVTYRDPNDPFNTSVVDLIPTSDGRLGLTTPANCSSPNTCDFWKQEGDGGVAQTAITSIGLKPATTAAIKASQFASVGTRHNWLWSIPASTAGTNQDSLITLWPEPPAGLIESVQFLILVHNVNPTGVEAGLITVYPIDVTTLPGYTAFTTNTTGDLIDVVDGGVVSGTISDYIYNPSQGSGINVTFPVPGGIVPPYANLHVRITWGPGKLQPHRWGAFYRILIHKGPPDFFHWNGQQPAFVSNNECRTDTPITATKFPTIMSQVNAFLTPNVPPPYTTTVVEDTVLGPGVDCTTTTTPDPPLQATIKTTVNGSTVNTTTHDFPPDSGNTFTTDSFTIPFNQTTPIDSLSLNINTNSVEDDNLPELRIAGIEIVIEGAIPGSSPTPECPGPYICAPDPAPTFDLVFRYQNSRGLQREFSHTFGMINIYQVLAEYAAPPDNWDALIALGNGLRSSTARWESAVFTLDTVDGQGLDQCSTPLIFRTTGRGQLTFSRFGVIGVGRSAGACNPEILIEEANKGKAINAVQTIILPAPTGGTWTLTLIDQGITAVAVIGALATALQVQTKLEELANIGVGNVTVTGAGTGADPFRVEFMGTLAGRDMRLLEADGSHLAGAVSAFVSKLSSGTTNERQTISKQTGINSDLLIEFNSQQSLPIPFNSSLNAFQGFLEGISSIGAGNVAVSGNITDRDATYQGPWVVDFIGTLANQNVPTMVLQTVGYSIITDWQGGTGINDIQQIDIVASSGNFAITLTDPNNLSNTVTTALIAYNGGAPQIKTQILAVATWFVSADLIITKLPADPDDPDHFSWTVECTTNFANRAMPMMGLVSTNLRGAEITVNEVVQGSGNNERQKLIIKRARGGSYRLLLTMNNIETMTALIPWDASADGIELALQSLSFFTLASDVQVKDLDPGGDPDIVGSFVIVFHKRFGDVPLLGSQNNLTCTPLNLAYVPPPPYNYALQDCNDAESLFCSPNPLICRPGPGDPNPENSDTVPVEPCCESTTIRDSANFYREVILQRELFDPNGIGCCGGGLTVRDLAAKKGLTPSLYNAYLRDCASSVLNPVAMTTAIDTKMSVVLIEVGSDTPAFRARLSRSLQQKPGILPSRMTWCTSPSPQ